MMKPQRAIALGLIMALTVGAGCGGGSDDDATPSTDSAISTETSTGEPDEAPTSEAPPATTADASGDTVPDTEPPPTDPPSDPPLVESGGVVVLVTEPAEVATQPELAWEPVDGASRYRVVVLDAEGAPYWSWSGEENSVFLGGGSSSDGAGPTVGVGFTWSVTAFDADDEFLASSPLAPLAAT